MKLEECPSLKKYIDEWIYYIKDLIIEKREGIFHAYHSVLDGLEFVKLVIKKTSGIDRFECAVSRVGNSMFIQEILDKTSYTDDQKVELLLEAQAYFIGAMNYDQRKRDISNKIP